MSTDGTVDITNLVSQMKVFWVKWATLTVVAAAGTVPWLAWLNFPIIAPLFQFFVSKLMTVIANAVEMESFFLNTAIRKASQAKDFTDAVAALAAIPETASDAEYKAAEEKQMLAFRNFVRVTN